MFYLWKEWTCGKLKVVELIVLVLFLSWLNLRVLQTTGGFPRKFPSQMLLWSYWEKLNIWRQLLCHLSKSLAVCPVLYSAKSTRFHWYYELKSSFLSVNKIFRKMSNILMKIWWLNLFYKLFITKCKHPATPGYIE